MMLTTTHYFTCNCSAHCDVVDGVHLEDGLVVPVRIDLAQLSSDPVVFPDEESVDHGQHSLLVDSGVSGQETVDVLTWR